MAFATGTEWVMRLSEAKRAGRLAVELERLGRLSLVSSLYERSSLIVSSDKSFSAWSEVFGDPMAVAAMVDRLVHHAEVVVLKGDSYRLRGKGKEVMAAEETR